MDPLKYRHPIFVNPPFRDPLVAAVSGRVGEAEVHHLDRLLPMLDGTHSVADIYGRFLADGVSPNFVYGALEVLESLGCLAESPTTSVEPSEGNGSTQYRNQVGCLEEWLKVRHDADEARASALKAQAALGHARVLVMGLGGIGSALVESLASAGVGHLFGIRGGGGPEAEEQTASRIPARVMSLNPEVRYREMMSMEDLGPGNAESQATPSLLVYCPDVFNEPVCEALNRLVLDTGTPFLIYRENPFAVELGPLILPRQTACYRCYQLRRKAAEMQAAEPDETPPTAATGLNFSSGVSLLALEIVKILTRTAFPVTRGKLWRLGLFEGSVSVHPVLKLPRCPACGTHRVTPPRRIWEE